MMDLPWLQVAREMLDQAAPDIAVRLDLDEDAVVGKLVRLVRWALGRVPAGELPSKHAVITHPRVEQLVARAANYTGDPGAFVEALCTCQNALLERAAGGALRVRGLDRYDSAAEASEKARKAAEARWAKFRDAQAMLEHAPSTARASAPAMLGDAKTETKTETKTKAFVPGPEDLVRVDPVREQDADLVKLLGWKAEERNRRGLPLDAQPPPRRAEGDWWWDFVKRGLDLERVKAMIIAFYDDRDDSYRIGRLKKRLWEGDPPYPITAFIENWPRWDTFAQFPKDNPVRKRGAA